MCKSEENSDKNIKIKIKEDQGHKVIYTIADHAGLKKVNTEIS